MAIHIRRREFIGTLGSAAAAWPLVARAQQAAMPVIGFLHSEAATAFADPVAAFREGLREGGYVEAQNVAIEYRWGEGRNERLPELAAELVRRRVRRRPEQVQQSREKSRSYSITSSAMLRNDDGTVSPNCRSASCPPSLGGTSGIISAS